LLLFNGDAKTGQDALDLFAAKRTKNKKGVAIPSQMRWVRYFEKFLKNFHTPKKPFDYKGAPLTLTKLVIGPAPDFDVGGGCDPYFKVQTMAGKTIFNYKKQKGVKLKHFDTEDTREFNVIVPVQGEFKIVFYDEDIASKDDKMCGFWLHTSFITKSTFTLTKNELDGAVKDKKCHHFPKKFSIQISFKGVVEKHDEKDVPPPPPGDDDDDEEEEEDADVQYMLKKRAERAKAAGPAPKKGDEKKAEHDSDDDIPPPPPEDDD